MNDALLVIDVQLASFPPFPPALHIDALLSTTCRLVERARGHDVPVLFVQHCGGSGDPDEPGTPRHPIHPQITPMDAEIVVRKRSPDAFHDTELHQELQKRRIERLTICGIQTEYCVDTTTRRAYSLGYRVRLVSDGHSTWDGEPFSASQKIAHHNQVLGGWFAELVEAQSVDFS